MVGTRLKTSLFEAYHDLTMLFQLLTATSEDYKLLAELNNLTISKYEEMSNSTNKLINNMEEINEKCAYTLCCIEVVDPLSCFIR